MGPRQIDMLIAVCKAYGYGNVMQMASTLWRMDVQKRGQPDTFCFVPTCIPFIKEEYREMAEDSYRKYRSHVEAYLKSLDEIQMR